VNIQGYLSASATASTAISSFAIGAAVQDSEPYTVAEVAIQNGMLTISHAASAMTTIHEYQIRQLPQRPEILSVS
jgi:hypothetical protein